MVAEILIPVAIVGGLGLFFGLSLSYASKKFEVKVDEKVNLVRETLPGANCAACGQIGCDAFAEAVVAGKVPVTGCTVGGTAVAKKIADILGVDMDNAAEDRIARVMCGGTCETTKDKYEYKGIMDCDAAAALYGGPSACLYKCVGMGTCERACPFNAIVVENGLARIVQSKCTGCGICVKACPKKIIELVPKHTHHTVVCSSLDKGNVVRQICTVGCIGCTRCVKACPVGAISMNGSLARIDAKKCTNCGECAKVCPSNTIKCF